MHNGFDHYTDYRPRPSIPDWVYAAAAAYALIVMFPPIRKPVTQMGGAMSAMVGRVVSGRRANVMSASGNRTVKAKHGVVVDAAGAAHDANAYKAMTEEEKMSAKKSLDALLASHDKVVMMIFAPWCGHCHTNMPVFDVAASHASSDVLFVFVNAEALPRSAWSGEGKLLDLAYFPSFAFKTGKDAPLQIKESLDAALSEVPGAMGSSQAAPVTAETNEPSGSEAEMLNRLF